MIRPLRARPRPERRNRVLKREGFRFVSRHLAVKLADAGPFIEVGLPIGGIVIFGGLPCYSC
jgi:hypothetical protein